MTTLYYANYYKSAACFCYQVAATVLDMLCNFMVKNKKLLISQQPPKLEKKFMHVWND
jgi:hypothetical protein